ncbi:MAG: DUF998 domain-containing protein [Gammaproteobacteria bacterium]|nr:DUF998 domain-containing protein [Gammaproteobacteria bacterium]MBU1414680.1 DUF998 domain-containing protein [Gammaproteobacteria bacterium]
MTEKTTPDPSLVLSYLGLRRAIGIIGVGLPFALVLGKWLLESPGLQPSISDYYYTVMRDVFVGCMYAIGIFLMSYRGYEKADNIAGNLACVFAIGVACFPTTPLDPTPLHEKISYVHFSCAAAFFLTLAYFCLKLFTKTNPDKAMTRRKGTRNLIYKVCGWIILACVGLLAIYAAFLRDSVLARYELVFWLETIAILAFGFSWLTKGEAILGDEA